MQHRCVAERAAARPARRLLKIDGNVVRRAMRDRRRARARRGGLARRRRPPARADERARRERLRFVLALDDDLEPFHRAHRARPAARPGASRRKPEAAGAAQARAVRGARVGGDRAADRHAARREHRLGVHAPPRRRSTRAAPWAAPTPRAVRQPAPRSRRAGLAPTQSRTLARVARAVATVRSTRRRPTSAGSTRSPASASGRSRTSTCSAAAATTSRSPRTSACATRYARIAGVRTGSVTEAEFKAVLDRYAPCRAWPRCTSSRRAGAAARGGHNPPHDLRRR